MSRCASRLWNLYWWRQHLKKKRKKQIADPKFRWPVLGSRWLERATDTAIHMPVTEKRKPPGSSDGVLRTSHLPKRFEPSFAHIATSPTNRASVLPIDMYPQSGVEAPAEANGYMPDDEKDKRYYAEPKSDPAFDADEAVTPLLASLLHVLAAHRERTIAKGEPTGFRTRWWYGLARNGDEKKASDGKTIREFKSKSEADNLYDHEEKLPPTRSERALAERLRKERELEGTRQVLSAVALLRARCDLLMHRLPRINSDEDDSLSLLAGVIGRTPIAGELDLLMPAAGVEVPAAPHGTFPFARGTPHAYVADPMLLSMDLHTVQNMAGMNDDDQAYLSVLGQPPLPVLVPSRADPDTSRPQWEGPGNDAFPGLSGPLTQAYPPYESVRKVWRPPPTLEDHDGGGGEVGDRFLTSHIDPRDRPHDEGHLEVSNEMVGDKGALERTKYKRPTLVSDQEVHEQRLVDRIKDFHRRAARQQQHAYHSLALPHHSPSHPPLTFPSPSHRRYGDPPEYYTSNDNADWMSKSRHKIDKHLPEELRSTSTVKTSERRVDDDDDDERSGIGTERRRYDHQYGQAPYDKYGSTRYYSDAGDRYYSTMDPIPGSEENQPTQGPGQHQKGYGGDSTRSSRRSHSSGRTCSLPLHSSSRRPSGSTEARRRSRRHSSGRHHPLSSSKANRSRRTS